MHHINAMPSVGYRAHSLSTKTEHPPGSRSSGAALLRTLSSGPPPGPSTHMHTHTHTLQSARCWRAGCWGRSNAAEPIRLLAAHGHGHNMVCHNLKQCNFRRGKRMGTLSQALSAVNPTQEHRKGTAFSRLATRTRAGLTLIFPQ